MCREVEYEFNICDNIAEYLQPQYNLITCLRKGIIYHHGSVPDAIRIYIEDLYKETDGFKTEFAFFTSKCEIYQILSNVRNKILEWALVLEDNGIIGEGMAFTDEEKKKAQDTGIVNNYTNNFYSDVSDIEMEQG